MNALGDHCRSVIVLVEGEPESSAVDTMSTSSGFHVTCVLPTGDKPLSDAVTAAIDGFAQVFNVPLKHLAWEDTQRLTALSSPSNESAGASVFSTALTVLHCTTKDLAAVRSSVLAWPRCAQAAADSTSSLEPAVAPGGESELYSLLAELDLSQAACNTVVPPSTEAATRLTWLRPPPSYLSELAQSGSASPATLYAVPVHLFSNQPIIRSRGANALTTGTDANKCTIDALLRELAFKAGYLPKYGA